MVSFLSYSRPSLIFTISVATSLIANNRKVYLAKKCFFYIPQKIHDILLNDNLQAILHTLQERYPRKQYLWLPLGNNNYDYPRAIT